MDVRHMAVAMPSSEARRPPYRSRSVCYFSAIQNSRSNVSSISWLCLEARLSVMRLTIFGLWNLTKDDAPPLLELDYEHKPLPKVLTLQLGVIW